MLLAERLAYGARAVIMASMVVSGAMFLRMMAAEGGERGHVRGQRWPVRICTDRRGVTYCRHRTLRRPGCQTVRGCCSTRPLLAQEKPGEKNVDQVSL